MYFAHSFLSALLAISLITQPSIALPETYLHTVRSTKVRRDDISISGDPEMFPPKQNGCKYKWTSMLQPGDEAGQLYTADGFAQWYAITGFVEDSALGAAIVALAINLQWEPQVWAWVDEDSSRTIVKVNLKGPNGGEVIMSDTLPQGQNTNNGCFDYFGYSAPHDTGEAPVMQMALMEKALAITKGSYQALNGLSATDAFAVLTGQPGTVAEGKVGSSNDDLSTTISDAITNNQPCVVELITSDDLETFEEWDATTQKVDLPIGTLNNGLASEDTTIFTSDNGDNYAFQGAPIMYTPTKSDGNGIYFWNVDVYNPSAEGQDDDPNYGLLLPKQLIPFIVKTVTTWTPEDDNSGVSVRSIGGSNSRSPTKAATDSNDPVAPAASLLGQSSSCAYTYQEPPAGPVFDIRGLVKDNVNEGPFPDCAIGASTLALLQAKQFSLQMSRGTDDPLDDTPKYIYGSFYSSSSGTKVPVQTSTKLLMVSANSNCKGFLGYQGDSALYVPYLEKLLAKFLDDNPTLKPKDAAPGKGYNGIANIPVDFVMQAMTGKVVTTLSRPINKAYFPDFSAAAITLATTSANSNGARPAVVFPTITSDDFAKLAANSPAPKGTWDGTTFAVPLPNGGGTAKVVKTVFGTRVAWKVSIPNQKDVMLFGHHAYAIVAYDPSTSMFTVANPFQFNYDTQGNKIPGAEMKIHKSVVDVFAAAVFSVSP